jgi:archaellum component FlaG (FlaF/FlaG flagellin family)
MRIRRHYTIAALLILLVAIALSASLVTANANAQATFTVCGGCHTKAATHAVVAHVPFITNLQCANCHTNGTDNPPTPAACAACHGAAAILATHLTQACGTTPGCHGVPAPITTAVSLKVAPASIKLKKTVKATGTVTPAADLAGIKVLLKAEIKVGKAWKAAKAGSATVSAAGIYVWTYKPAKKGSYRMTASIKATDDYKGSKSPTKLFKVK